MLSLAVIPPPPDTFAQYVLPAIIGAIAGVIGGLITAGAMLLNGLWQRKQDLTLEHNQNEQKTLGVRREIESRLIEFSEKVAQFRSWGFGDSAGIQSTFDRLDTLMEAEKGGPAALPSDELTRDVYSMLNAGRRNLRALDQTMSNDRSVEDRLTPAELNDWRERCQINYSAILANTSAALTKIFVRTGDDAAAKELSDADVRLAERTSDYAKRADAVREAMLRSVLASHITAEEPTDVGTP